MIPYDVDPSLHNADPQPEQLDDGFSPPPRHPVPPRVEGEGAPAGETVDPSLWSKSLF